MKFFQYGVWLGIPITGTFPAVRLRQAVVLNWATMSVFQLGFTYIFLSKLGRWLVPEVLPGSYMERYKEFKIKVAPKTSGEQENPS